MKDFFQGEITLAEAKDQAGSAHRAPHVCAALCLLCGEK